jgi:hypothetical protein
MRTVLIILGGFALWGIVLGLARGFSLSSTAATILFGVLWLVIAGVNMWAGVARAGYSVQEELPIFGVIFLTPVIVAALVNWKFL